MAMLWLTLQVEAHALQMIEVDEGTTVIVNASLRDPTRISIAGGKITGVKHVKGRLQINKDERAGAIIVMVKRPDDYIQTGSIAPNDPVIYVTDTEGRTFTLKLSLKDWPAQNITLQTPRPPRNVKAKSFEQADTYTQVISSLIKKMARLEIPDGYVVNEINKVIPAWKEANLVLERTFVGDAFVGEYYTLTNISSSDMYIQEHEMNRPGVLAVSIEHHLLKPDDHILKPGQSTMILIVRENRDDV